MAAFIMSGPLFGLIVLIFGLVLALRPGSTRTESARPMNHPLTRY
jgi:hypothetical protein